jgi:hypothetical protein
MATVAVSIREAYTVGDCKRVVADVTLTGSYVVGGESVTPAMLKLPYGLRDVDVDNAVGSLGMVGARYNMSTKKIQLYGNSDASAAINEASPEMTAVALPGGPLTVTLRAEGLGAPGKA